MKLDRPRVMGILNVTPDSFYQPVRTLDADDAVTRVGRMLDEGADIIDIGACSTRPGSESVSAEEELDRLEKVLPEVRRAYPEALLSVDTFRASVARVCMERWGADIINDVSGGDDPEMFAEVARGGAAYVLMHKRGTPSDMDSRCVYDDVTGDIIRELAFRLDAARKAGLCDVIIDPGFGFAKTSGQGMEILGNLERLAILGCPLLVGFSRKRMAGGSLAATVALNAVAIAKGAAFIRVHDVAEGVQTARTIGKLWTSE